VAKIGGAKMSLEKRGLIEREKERLRAKTGIAARTLAGFAGVSGGNGREGGAGKPGITGTYRGTTG
jgi:hypothetical protein